VDRSRARQARRRRRQDRRGQRALLRRRARASSRPAQEAAYRHFRRARHAARHRRGRQQGAAAARRDAVLSRQLRYPVDRRFDAKLMDALLLVAPAKGSIGYAGSGDFSLHADGRLVARVAGTQAPLVYAGAAILSPALFDQAPDGAFSLTALFERAAAKGRLRGLRLEGLWMHVGTPDAIAKAEAAIAAAR